MSSSPATLTRRRRTRSAADVPGGQIQFIDHPELQDASMIRELITTAARLLDGPAELNREEELVLFRALHACGLAATASRQTRVTGWSRQRLARLHRRLVDRLVNANMGLVYEMRRRFKPGREVDSDDLMSEGLWTLYQAVTSFNPWKGFRFTTYACRSILRRYVWFSQRRRRQMQQVNDLRERAVGDSTCSESRSDLDTELMVERLREVLDRNRAGLTPTERFVLERRLLHPVDERPETLEALGRQIQFSRERVRQIQENAVAKLREALMPSVHELAA